MQNVLTIYLAPGCARTLKSKKIVDIMQKVFN